MSVRERRMIFGQCGNPDHDQLPVVRSIPDEQLPTVLIPIEVIDKVRLYILLGEDQKERRDQLHGQILQMVCRMTTSCFQKTNPSFCRWTRRISMKPWHRSQHLATRWCQTNYCGVPIRGWLLELENQSMMIIRLDFHRPHFGNIPRESQIIMTKLSSSSDYNANGRFCLYACIVASCFSKQTSRFKLDKDLLAYKKDILRFKCMTAVVLWEDETWNKRVDRLMELLDAEKFLSVPVLEVCLFDPFCLVMGCLFLRNGAELHVQVHNNH